MDAWRRSRPRWSWLTATLLLTSGPVNAEEPALPLAVHDGRCSCVLPVRRADDKYYLVVASAARGAGPYRVRIDTEATTGPAAIEPYHAMPDEAWLRRITELRARLARATSTALTEDYPALAAPPAQRLFHLFLGDDDFGNAARYTAIQADLRGCGRHCQVYVDRTIPDLAALQPTVDDAVRVFDEDIFPQARRRLGRVLDVDRDGRFTILFTPRLAQLSNGKVSLGGFVRGSDFYRDLAAPFGNRCDMMYLNGDLKPGVHLRSLLAHEYTHAVVFSEHVFGAYLPERAPQDEESWLNEALAHVNEDLHGYSWSNLDYRISAFLSDPARYALVVPDYYGAGLYRSHGHRGATYLFLRWCVDQFGNELLGRLVHSNLSGIDNLEVATGRPFAELFRAWTTSLASGGRTPTTRPFGRLLCGARPIMVPLAGGHADVTLARTSAAYLLLHSPLGIASRVTVSAEADAELQVSLIRCPEPTARLSLEVRWEDTKPRLALTAHDCDVTLTAAAWERLVPTDRRDEDTSYRPDTAANEVRTWWGDPELQAGATRTSPPIALPQSSEACVFKVAGTDSAGHAIAAWAVVPRR